MYRYLMVHDLVWINTALGGASQPFDYARLEAVVAAQYDFGQQRPIAQITASVIAAVLEQVPFGAHNQATAFLAGAALLAANGCPAVLEAGPAADALAQAASGARSPEEAARQACELGGSTPHLHRGSLRHLVARLCAVHAPTIEKFTKRGTTQNV